MTASKSKNDRAWEIIFTEEQILNVIARQGFFQISSTRINQQREARLMTKFDHAVQLPQIFKDNNLTIQPISRGNYIIGTFDYKIRNLKTGLLHNIKVTNSQCEIDGGFEGESQFAIIEAKSETINDFIVRQLYYPYRLWNPSIPSTTIDNPKSKAPVVRKAIALIEIINFDRKNHPMIRHYPKRYQRTTSPN